MSLFLGVDGGKTGALAFYRPTEPMPRIYSVPLLVRKVRGKPRSEVDADALNAILAVELAGEEDVKAFVEMGVGDRRQSTAAGYTYGFTNGAVWMAICARIGRSSVELVHPSLWKRFMGLIGKDKTASRNKAKRFWPTSHDFDRESDHNKAEAALIALYGQQCPPSTTSKKTESPGSQPAARRTSRTKWGSGSRSRLSVEPTK